MGQLTEKQFNMACKPNVKKYGKWIEAHPVEYTDEWIYEYQKMIHLGNGYGGGSMPYTGGCGLAEPSGYYHYMSNDQEV